MKIGPRESAAWLSGPPVDAPGTLIHGADPERVAMRRADLVAAIVGPDAAQEMRLERLNAADLRGDPAALIDAAKARGFFPGPRAVIVDDATNQHAKPILAALSAWSQGDAHMVVACSALKPASPIRKAFESHPRAGALAVYDDPLGPAEVEAELARAGLRPASRDVAAQATEIARGMGPGEWRRLIEKLALWSPGDEALTEEALAACAPLSGEAALDAAVEAVARGEVERIAQLIARLEAQGTAPVALCIAMTRHLRRLHQVASDPGGPAAGAARLRPPAYGPRRDAIVSQSRAWGARRLEEALQLLVTCDLSLRGGSPAPQMALLERTLVRLAMMSRG